MHREAFVVVFLALVSLPASALPSRVFVKSTGMDVGACPITATCRSFAYALTQVAASGEVIALDTAGYGPFVVTQSVSVFAAPGATAFIAVSSGTGILIHSPVSSTDVVVLRGLALSGTGGGFGVEFNAGHSLAIENCIINGFSSEGVLFERTGDTSRPVIRIDHTTIRNNGGGIEAMNFGAALPPLGMTISNSTLSDGDNWGVAAGENVRVVVTDTVVTGNVEGIYAGPNSDNAAEIDLERCTITGNYRGILAGIGASQFPRAVVRIAHNVITGNTIGVTENSDGRIMTMTSAGTATNTIEANGTDGTFTGAYVAK